MEVDDDDDPSRNPTEARGGGSAPVLTVLAMTKLSNPSVTTVLITIATLDKRELVEIWLAARTDLATEVARRLFSSAVASNPITG